jgi:hypothetical protein
MSAMVDEQQGDRKCPNSPVWHSPRPLWRCSHCPPSQGTTHRQWRPGRSKALQRRFTVRDRFDAQTLALEGDLHYVSYRKIVLND